MTDSPYPTDAQTIYARLDMGHMFEWLQMTKTVPQITLTLDFGAYQVTVSGWEVGFFARNFATYTQANILQNWLNQEWSNG
jgi:hypothetical protein